MQDSSGKYRKGQDTKGQNGKRLDGTFFNHSEEYKADADIFLVFRGSTHRKVLHNNVCDV